MNTTERSSILDLLATHVALLARHKQRLIDLMAIALERDLDAADLAFVVADVAGAFGQQCIEQGAGIEFLSILRGQGTMVYPLDVPGLVALLQGVIPEGMEPVTSKAAGMTPVLIVDGQDEPAIVLMATTELVPTPCS